MVENLNIIFSGLISTNFCKLLESTVSSPIVNLFHTDGKSGSVLAHRDGKYPRKCLVNNGLIASLILL